MLTPDCPLSRHPVRWSSMLFLHKPSPLTITKHGKIIKHCTAGKLMKKSADITMYTPTSGNNLARNICLRIFSSSEKHLSEKYFADKYFTENLMKKSSADITMRGRPERQEMLQLEAAMSASLSHKPPSFLLNQHILWKSFQFWAKYFMLIFSASKAAYLSN